MAMLVRSFMYSDGETLVSADDVRINLWHAEVTRQCFNIVDMKPADMEDLVGDFVVFLLVLPYPPTYVRTYVGVVY